MNDESAKLETAKWILEKNFAWIASAEVKTAFLFTFATAMLGAIASLVGQVKAGGWSDELRAMCIITLGLLGWAIVCTAMVVFPRTKGPTTSMIFFGKIANKDLNDYIASFQHYDCKEALSDCLNQVHRNAQIACDKFSWIRRAMWAIFLAILPWLITLAMLMNVKDM